VPRTNGPICLEQAGPGAKPLPVTPSMGNTGHAAIPSTSSSSALPGASGNSNNGNNGPTVPGLYVDLSPRGFELRAAALRERYGPAYRPPPGHYETPQPTDMPSTATSTTPTMTNSATAYAAATTAPRPAAA